MSSFLKTLRTRPDVLPVVVITGIGAVMAAYCTVRTCTKANDVSWKHQGNPHPYESIKYNENTKFVQAYDYANLKDERPKF